MKKWLAISCLIAGVTSTAVYADAAKDLQGRLNKVNSFHANFSQKVTSADGAAVQEGEGELWLKRPNLFNWKTTSPDESTLISDGKTLWFYNPFVEQVTATWLKDATGNTPFILITRNDTSDWNKYDVRQKGDDFELTPKSASGNLKQFAINVTTNGTIKQFTATEQDGQRSTYVLKNQQNGAVDAAQFTFTPPKGVTLDDQRQ
ncbi:outer-membrane lipoprotein carrier protein [Pectobacterium carotovorum subsp. carotovorum]|nr:outer-membrane lipoprotein carrier protein [Pectobacterium carotovorum subsp. carotovorum]